MTLRILAVLCFLLSAASAAAGVVFEFETLDPGAPEQGTDTIHTVVEGDSIKIDVKGPHGADADMIYRGASRELLAVDHAKKSYVLIDEATFAKIGEQLSGLEAQMREALKDVPPEQRAMVEQMMRQRMPQELSSPESAKPVMEVRKTDEKATRNGYPSIKHELYQNGRRTKDIWVTDWDNVEGGREAVRAFENMAEFLQQMQDTLPSFAQSPESGNQAFEHLEELGGFPVVTVEYADDGSVKGENHLKTSRIEDVDPAIFATPADYRRQDMFPQ